MSEWEPATDAEVAMRDALRTDDQESYFRILAGVDLLLPVSADALAGLAPLGWGTWSTGGRTHVLAFTSQEALRSCLSDYTGSARRVPYAELANTWPNLEWWLAVNPGLPIEGYLPAWFVAQLARGDLRLPTRGPGRETHPSSKIKGIGAAGLATSRGADGAGGPTYDPAASGASSPAVAGMGRAGTLGPAGVSQVSPAVPPTGGSSSPMSVPPASGRPGGFGGPAASGPGSASGLPSGSGPAGAPRPGAPAGGQPPVGPGGLPMRTPGVPAPSGLPGRPPAAAGPSGPAAPGDPSGLVTPAGYQPPAIPQSPGGMPPGPVPSSGGPTPGRPGAGTATPGWEKGTMPFSPDEDPRGPLQDLKAPLPVRTPMANTPPVPEHVKPYDPAEAAFSPSWPGVGGDASAAGSPAGGAREALPRRQPGQSAGSGQLSSMPGFVPAGSTPPGAAPTSGFGPTGSPSAPAPPSPGFGSAGSPSAPATPAPGRGLAGSSSAPSAPTSGSGPAAGSPGAPASSGFAPTAPSQSFPQGPASPHAASTLGSPGPAPATGGPGSPLPRRQVTPPSERPSTMAAAAQALGSGRQPAADQQDRQVAPAGTDRFGPSNPAPSVQSAGAAGQELPPAARPPLVPPVIPGTSGADRGAPVSGAPGGSSVPGYPGPVSGAPGYPGPVSGASGYPGQSSGAPGYGAVASASGYGSPASPTPAGGFGASGPGLGGPGGYGHVGSAGGFGSGGSGGAAPSSPAAGGAGPSHSSPVSGSPVSSGYAPPSSGPTSGSAAPGYAPASPASPAPGYGAVPAGSALGYSSPAPAIPGMPPQGSPAAAYATQGHGASAFTTQVLPIGAGAYGTAAANSGLGVAGSSTGSRVQANAAAQRNQAAGDFVAANDVERELREAADAGNTDVFLSTLLLANVLVPVASHSRPGSSPGESGFAFLPEEVDGERFLIVFTSKDRLSEHFGEPTRTVGVRFYELIRNWPDPAWSFAVNPGTPVGAKYPGAQIIALANWATEAGLGAEPADGTAGDDASTPVPAPEPASDEAQSATVMQKTITAEQVDYYLDRGYDRVAGFVHRASEVEHLRTPGELFSALGLYYDSSPFQPDAKEAFVLRWPAYRPSLYRIPYGGQNEQALRAMDGWVIERPPFRGNGFAPGEGRDVIAEFKVDSVRLPHGAQLWRIDADGAERMMAIFDADGPLWRRVGEH